MSNLEELEEESEKLKAFEEGTLERITYAARICELLGAKAAELQEAVWQPPSFLTSNPLHELLSQPASYKG